MKTIFYIVISILLLLGGSRILRQHQPETGFLPIVTEERLPGTDLLQILLSGSRGIFCELLWQKIDLLQREDRFVEMIPLTNWLTHLDPRSTGAWMFNAWNLSYNVSVMYSTPEERWPWVLRGIDLLTEGALKYNPNDPAIYNELGWLYEHKIASNRDTAHAYYKEQLRALPIRYDTQPVEAFLGKIDWRTPEAYAFSYYQQAQNTRSQLRIVMRLLSQGNRQTLPAFITLAKATYTQPNQSDQQRALLDFARRQCTPLDPQGTFLLEAFIQEMLNHD